MLGWMKPKKPDVPVAAAQAPVAAAPAPRPTQPPAPRPTEASSHAQAQVSAKSLPAILLEQGKASREQLERALAIQKETGAFLGGYPVEEGILDEKSLLSFLAKFCKIPHLSLLDYLIDAEVAALVPRVLLEYRLIPIDKLGKNLTIAMVNPLNTRALEVVQAHCPDLRIKPILCAHKHFEAVVAKVFADDRGAKGGMDLSMSSFGISLSPAEKAAYATRRAESAALAAAEEIPAASPVDSPMDFAEKKMSDSTHHRVRFAEEAGQEDLPDTQSVFQGVFHAAPATDESADDGDAELPDKILKEVTNAMMVQHAGYLRNPRAPHGPLPGPEAEMIAKIFARGLTVEYEAGEVIFKRDRRANPSI